MICWELTNSNYSLRYTAWKLVFYRHHIQIRRRGNMVLNPSNTWHLDEWDKSLSSILLVTCTNKKTHSAHCNVHITPPTHTCTLSPPPHYPSVHVISSQSRAVYFVGKHVSNNTTTQTQVMIAQNSNIMMLKLHFYQTVCIALWCIILSYH